MTRRPAWRSMHVLLACIALSASTAVIAQPHPGPEEPDYRMIVLERDKLSRDELRGANPCARNRAQAKDEADYQKMVGLAFCLDGPRRRAVTQAWSMGLDAYGEPLAPDARARKLIEMEEWLRSLPGKYQIDGWYGNAGGVSPVRGNADCFGVGSGPGVACSITAKWKAPKEAGAGKIKDRRLDNALYNALRPMVLLFGIDPGSLQARVTVMDFRAITMSGFLDEGTVVFGGRPNFESLFANPLVTYTWTNIVVTTKPGGGIGIKLPVRAADFISTPHAIMLNLQLHRDARAASSNRPPDVIPEEMDEQVAGDEEDVGQEGEASAPALQVTVPAPRGSGKQAATLDVLDEVVAEGERERRRQARSPRLVGSPDIVTVARTGNRAVNGSLSVRMQPYDPRSEIRLRPSNARKLATGANPNLQLKPDRLITDDGLPIRSVALEFNAGMDEADGLPALIPINATTSLFNYDYVRLLDSGQPLIARVRNVLHPETRSCVRELGLGTGAEGFRNRYVLLADRLGDCDRTARSREGDFIFAEPVPQRLREELQDIYSPLYNYFARNLGSEPGVVFVIWRPESPRNDFRLVPSLSRTSLLVFNGPSWGHGIAALQRDSVWAALAQEQIARRISGGDVLNEAAAEYLLRLAWAEHRQTTSSWLATEVPHWISGCARAMSFRGNSSAASGGIYSYDCGLVVLFVYDALARAKSGGKETVMRSWRKLLADAYDRRQDEVSASAFLDSSPDARRIVQGLLGNAVDWGALATELGRVGVQLRLSPGSIAPSAQVQSLAYFMDP